MCVQVDIQDELGESSRILAGSIAGDVVKLHSAEVNVGGDGREHHYHMSSKRKQTRIRSPAEPSLSSPAAGDFSSLGASLASSLTHHCLTEPVQLACSYP
jgi:hypothetical protein